MNRDLDNYKLAFLVLGEPKNDPFEHDPLPGHIDPQCVMDRLSELAKEISYKDKDIDVHIFIEGKEYRDYMSERVAPITKAHIINYYKEN